MAVREIRLYGDPILANPSEPINTIDDGIRALVVDLCDTVREPGRAGVAACQIGVGLRAFSINIHGKIDYVLNPRLVETSGEPSEIDEGCLSVPDLFFPTRRFPHARVEGIDVEGRPVVLEGDGLMAQALQHEYDHLDGIVYVRRLTGEPRHQAMAAIRSAAWFGRRG